jgi:hypothetical protein
MTRTYWLFSLAIFAASAVNVFSQTADDYKVYDAVVRYMFRDGITQFDMNAKIGQIIIRDRTYSEYSWTPQKENWTQVKIRLRALTDETISAYELARKTEGELKAKLDIPFKYLLISDKQLGSVFPNVTQLNKPRERWNEYYKLYPDSAGYNSFSRVGYDKSGRQALVYFVNWCGELCGTGSYLLMERGSEGWAVKESGGMWIS